MKSEKCNPDIVEASEVLFKNNESFFKNHRVISPVKEKIKEDTQKETKEDGNDVSAWNNGKDPEVAGEEYGWDNKNEDMNVNIDVDSNKANDDDFGEHIIEENKGKLIIY